MGCGGGGKWCRQLQKAFWSFILNDGFGSIGWVRWSVLNPQYGAFEL
jgi:hypothetical protein